MALADQVMIMLTVLYTRHPLNKRGIDQNRLTALHVGLFDKNTALQTL